MNRLKLLAVIINYRTADLVIQCLEAVRPQLIEIGNSRAVVVDNASGDKSDDRIHSEIERRGWNDCVDLVRAPANLGFSAGNNTGIKHAKADAYLLINSDAFVQPSALRQMLQAMEQRSDAGLVSPRLLLPDGSLHISCYRVQSPASELLRAAHTGPLTWCLKRHKVVLPHPDEPNEPQWTSFACVLIKNSAIEQVGLMDEGYFMYFEDVDYCRRLRKAGWTILNWPAARVVHAKGGSGPVRSSISQRRRLPSYYYAARSRYFAKYYGIAGLWLANCLWTAGRAISLVREVLHRRHSESCDREWLDIWTNWAHPMTSPATAPENKR